MCSYLPALFESSLLPRQANKPALADALWAKTKELHTPLATDRMHHVLDGGGGGGGGGERKKKKIGPSGKRYNTI